MCYKHAHEIVSIKLNSPIDLSITLFYFFACKLTPFFPIGGAYLLGGQNSRGTLRDEISHLPNLRSDWVPIRQHLDKPKRSIIALTLCKYKYFLFQFRALLMTGRETKDLMVL